jgi:ketol-acid reductoisomerase
MELYGSGEVGEVFLTAAKVGLYTMLDRNASPACQYGIYTHKDAMVTSENRQQIQRIIDRIRDGSFASELVDDQHNGHARLNRLKADAQASEMVGAEATVRRLMNLQA